ncbi:LysR substrate-binding domain-containing protein [Kiloniella antarctica]|uniref:LysR substrate-binding domain-containing protein n=1 Tax=Kiloniella antarctica TaxID=1550907 RepID=A0ABW5BPC5_9PROT
MPGINNLDSKMHTHITELHAFNIASRHGSLTKAAQQLNLTQPALSQKIKRLESFVGEPLFLRQNRGVKLTQAGEALYTATHQSLSDIQDIFEQLHAKKSIKRVRISTDFAFAGHWLIPRLAKLRDNFQDLDIQVVTSQTPGAPLDIQSDLVISLQEPVGSTEISKKSCTLFAEEVKAICSPEFLNKHGPITSPKDLLTLPLLNLSASPEAPWHNWDSWFTQLGFKAQKPKAAISLSNYTLILQAAINHQGVALGWQGLIDDYMDQGLLVSACVETVQSSRAYIMSLNKGASPHVQSIYDWILKQC